LSRILGIDPGSRITGYSVIDDDLNGPRYIISGCLKVVRENFPERLKEIYRGVHRIVEEYSPDELAIEQVFMHKNADSALKLGHARGAAMCAVLAFDIPVFEYAARQVKQSVVGKGSADKEQVQQMVKYILGLHEPLTLDASDALGVAICHMHYRQTQRRLETMGIKRT